MHHIHERILVISPHTDDGELGAGGTIARYAEEGTEIHYLVFSSCGKSMPKGMHPDAIKSECCLSMETLGVSSKRLIMLDYEVRTFPEKRQEILDDIIKIGKEIKPDLVLLPSSHDTHQDHQVIYWEGLRAYKKQACIWGYEHPWNNLGFTTDIYIKLNKQHISTKLEALKHYNSQKNKSYFDERYIRSLAIVRGLNVDWQYAEAFELVRMAGT